MTVMGAPVVEEVFDDVMTAVLLIDADPVLLILVEPVIVPLEEYCADLDAVMFEFNEKPDEEIPVVDLDEELELVDDKLPLAVAPEPGIERDVAEDCVVTESRDEDND